MRDGSIAIIGASCRFPGAPNLSAFWHLLSSATDAVTEIDERRWSTRFYYHPTRGTPARSYTWAAGLITDADLFEPSFFGISPREAAQMDPQQRVLLELAWHAAEDAGLTARRLAGSDTGVFVGASTTDYRDLRLTDPASGDSYFMTGGTLSILANRLSYVFDLRGPSLTVDTACSSSLVALHHACEALRSGRIATAFVGGINLLLSPYPFLGFCRAAMLSRRGRCFSFDARADGYVRGEGGGVVILKPLAAALADGDRIRAVIRATGVNSDGRTIGLSLPSEDAQAALLREVYQSAGIDPDELAFFEMHGTGTPAGDPIEAAAVGRALGQSRGAPLPIGSVKSNIGHLEPASGMAGLLKTALALQHGAVPASLHCETPNPAIPFSALNLRLVQGAEKIAPGGCAGVNSFGFGGTNAHAVLSAASSAPPTQSDDDEPPPLVISARNEASLRQLAQGWHDTLAEVPARCAPALLRAAARRRDHHSQRLVITGADLDEIRAALADCIVGTETPAATAGTALHDGKLAFVFAGNGAQWPGMGRAAYEASDAFRAAIAEADAALKPGLGWSVADAIATGVGAEQLVRADVAQPLLFAIQVGIVTVLRGLGVEAAGYVGHSVGEIAAAWAAGALPLADAARVVVARSRQQERTRGKGRMAALALGGDAAAELLAELGSPLEVAAINATQAVTVSGPGAAIERLGGEARRRGVGFRALDLDFAFHSAAMDPTREGLLGDLAGLSSSLPRGLLVSTVTGGATGDGLLDAEYWWRNIRKPVRFAEALAALINAGCRIFVEVGPHPVLQSYLHDALRSAEGGGRTLSTLSRRHGREDPFPAIAARCHVAGCDITGAARFDGPVAIDGLPLYPWQRERFWFEPTVESSRAADPVFAHPLLGFRQPGSAASWLNHLDPQVLPWLADHRVEEVPVLPAAAVVEMALAAARLRRPQAGAIELVDVELRRPLPFDNGRAREIRAALVGDDGDWELSSRPRLTEEPLTLHAVARLTTAGERRAAPRRAAPQAITGEIDGETLYRLARGIGLGYGPQFRTVRRIELLGEHGAIVEFDATVIAAPQDYIIHPALLDGALQGLLALLAKRRAGLAGASFLPWRFGRVRADTPFGRLPAHARLELTRIGSRSAAADIVLYDGSGELIAELSDCWFRRVELGRRTPPEDSTLRIDLVPAPLSETAAPAVSGRIAEIVGRIADVPADRAARRQEQSLLLDALVAAIAREAVLKIVDPEIAFAVEDLVEGGVLSRDAVPLFGTLLAVLAQLGDASEASRQWRIAGTSELPAMDELWRLLLAEAPDLAAELTLAASAAAELSRLLAEGLPLQGGAPPAIIESLRHGSPISTAGRDAACMVLAEIAAAWPKERVLRVLEVGADAAATGRLVAQLAQTGVAFAYRALCPDADAAARLASVERFAGVGVGCWPLHTSEDDPGDARFDLVLSLHGGTRQPIDGDALERLRRLLAPGGVLIAVEPAPNPLWDVLFGCHAGWRRDGGSGSLGPPLRTPDEWRDALAIAGFSGNGTAPLSGAWPSTILWGRAPPLAEIPPRAAPPRPITLIATGAELAAQVCDGLSRCGHRVTVIDAAGFAERGDIGADNPEEEDGAVALLVIAGDDDPVEQAARLIALAAPVAAAAAQRRMPLWLVTAGAQQAPDGEETGLVGAALWGFGRVLVNEIPRLSLTLVDFDPDLGWGERAEKLSAELAAATAEREIVWTRAGRHVLRLRRGLPPRWAERSDAVALTGGAPGGIDALGWQTAVPRPPGPGEVAIDVEAAALNFRDVMWAMGLLPEEALIDGFAGASFGLECAGIISAVGAGVDAVAVGDRVAGLAPAALASRVVTTADGVTRIPADMPLAAAATIPVAFVTAFYALGTLAKLMAGETVLIHAAAGGVGLAAIQYAKHCGAVVIASAGSALKRDFLRLAGADHVVNSRDPGFADAVRALTGGAGVDVVLNSLSGEAMEQSLGVLKPFGRFLELGKRDFYLNRRLHMRPLRRNVSYYAIDVDQVGSPGTELEFAL